MRKILLSALGITAFLGGYLFFSQPADAEIASVSISRSPSGTITAGQTVTYTASAFDDTGDPPAEIQIYDLNSRTGTVRLLLDTTCPSSQCTKPATSATWRASVSTSYGTAGDQISYSAVGSDGAGNSIDTGWEGPFTVESPPDPPVLSTSPSSGATINFGSSDLSVLPRPGVVTITNTGGGTLSTTSAVTASPSSNFSCVSNCTFNLSAGNSINVGLEFDASSPGTYNGSLIVQTNGGNASFDLEGTVTGGSSGGPEVEVSAGGNTYENGDTFDFGEVSGSDTQTFIIRNNGTGTLSGNVTVDGPRYSCAAGCGSFNLSGSASRSVTVGFTPSPTSSNQGTLDINLVGLSNVLIDLIGSMPGGGGDEPFVSSTEVLFGAQEVDTTSDPEDIIITNGTGDSLSFVVCVSGTFCDSGTDSFGLERATDSFFTLSPGASRTVSFWFNPDDASIFTEIFTIEASLAGTVVWEEDITLEGIGTPAGSGTGPTASFTSSVVGRTVHLTNTSALDSSCVAGAVEWDFGDGNTSTDPDPMNHTYSSDGAYTIELTITDCVGTDTFSQTVTIGSGGPTGGTGGLFAFENPLEADSLEELIMLLIEFILTLAIIILPIMILIGGFYFLTAGGDPGRLARGKAILTWSILGFVIVLLSRAIVELIQNILGV